MSGNQTYDNRSTHDMFCIIEGQTMESQSLVSLNGLFHLIAMHPLWMTSEENLSPGHN